MQVSNSALHEMSRLEQIEKDFPIRIEQYLGIDVRLCLMRSARIARLSHRDTLIGVCHNHPMLMNR